MSTATSSARSGRACWCSRRWPPTTPTTIATGSRARSSRCASSTTTRGVMNRSVADAGGAILAVSQFTLFASTRKGNRPSWSGAAPPEIARPRFDAFVAALAEALGQPVPTGVFGADDAGRAGQRRPGDDLARFARTGIGSCLVRDQGARTSRRDNGVRFVPATGGANDCCPCDRGPCVRASQTWSTGPEPLRGPWPRRIAIVLAALAVVSLPFPRPLLGTPVDDRRGDPRRDPCRRSWRAGASRHRSACLSAP